MSSSPSNSPKNLKRGASKIFGQLKNQNLFLSQVQRGLDDVFIPSPIQSMTAPKGKKFKASFRKFLEGNIDTKQLIDQNNFQSSTCQMIEKYEYIRSHKESITSFKDAVTNKEHNQIHLLEEKLSKIKQAKQKNRSLNKRERFYELSLRVKKGKKNLTKSENALLRWKKIRDVVHTNAKLRRNILDEKKIQTKFIDSLELAFQKSSDFYTQNLRSHQLRTMTVLKEKKLFHSTHQNLSPRYYHYLLNLQFKENSDDYVFLHFSFLPTKLQDQFKKNDQIYDRILQTYLQKKRIYEQWQEEQKNRKIIHWKSEQSSNKSHTTNYSIGLNKRKPMQRLENPFQQTKKLKEIQSRLIEQVNDIEKIDNDSKSQLKQLLHKSGKNKNQKGIIKHNRFLSFPSNQNSDQIEDFQDNISNASITEALLDQLYQGANSLQQKINNSKGLNFQRKVRDYLRLEEIKVQTIRANNLKLIPKQHDQLK